ncbi:MAG: glycerol-3-phosphate acyltransferase [Dehalococcoidia bacterium]|nr:glycerol-3-phosphate acyltransferase [Dehalococcoidia bacterium]
MESLISNSCWWLPPAGFVAGSCPFAVWLSYITLQTDIRNFGDRNPGTANAWKAGGAKLGIPVLILEYLKGAAPVYAAIEVYSLSGWGLVPVALAPVLGHAFSPFLLLRGGRGIAASFGVWSGLTLWEGPTILGLSLAAVFVLQAVPAWSFVLGMLGLLGYWIWQGSPAYILVIWLGIMLIYSARSARDFRTSPRLRDWVSAWLRRVRSWHS